MERLTYRLNDQFDNPTDSIILMPYLRYEDSETRKKILNRLAAYEDSGLEPEQVMELKSFTQGGSHKVDDGWKHVHELLQAEQTGRLVVLPCKVGDTVWYITPSTEICKAQVIGIWLNVYTNPQMWLEIKYYSKFTGECEHKSRIDLMLDKTVFLTREEAEAALKGGDG